MTGNLLPWIVLASVVVASLAWKGYLKFPSSAKKFEAPYAVASPVTYQDASPTEASLLEKLDSHTLGVYFALAKRREAEANLAHTIAAKAGAEIEAMFTAPFSKPEPAGQDPNQAGVLPLTK